MAAPRPAAEALANVLLVDDTPANLNVLGGMLKEQGCIVRPVPSGKLALRFAEADPPDIILLDIMMPEMDGYEVCRRLKAIERLKDIPVIFISALHETMEKVKAFATGGVDYITKPFQFEEVQARLRTHLNIRRLQLKLEAQNLQLSELNEALRKSQSALEGELAHAAKYVLSLIPAPIEAGAVRTNWLYVPSTRLGGDSLGYHWIDDTHFAMYLLDVAGHGIGPALLSVSVLNTLRSQCLPDTDFRCPEQVLTALNSRFRKKEQYGLFFTIWYGVFNRGDRTLRYSSGGHPLPLLVDSSQAGIDLDDPEGLAIGLFSGTKYGSAVVQVPTASTLYVFSDGCYEVQRLDGNMWVDVWSKEQLTDYLTNIRPEDSLQLEALYQHLISVRGEEHLADDFSILCATFP